MLFCFFFQNGETKIVTIDFHLIFAYSFTMCTPPYTLVTVDRVRRSVLQCDRAGRSPLHLAAAAGQINVLCSLLELQPGLAQLPDTYGQLLP